MYIETGLIEILGYVTQYTKHENLSVMNTGATDIDKTLTFFCIFSVLFCPKQKKKHDCFFLFLDMDYENIISEIIDLINHLITFKNINERTKYYEINK